MSLYFYSEKLRISCGKVFLNYSGEIGFSKNKGNLVDNVESITTKYKEILSSEVSFSRPLFSPIYNEKIMSALEEKARVCRRKLYDYIAAFESKFLGSGKDAHKENVAVDFFVAYTELMSSLYAFEYNSYQGSFIKLSMVEHIKLMHFYYNMVYILFEDVQNGNIGDIEFDDEVLVKQKNRLEKDFNIMAGYMLIMEFQNKKNNKDYEDRMNALKDRMNALKYEVGKSVDQYYSIILEEYASFKEAKKQDELNSDHYISLFLSVINQDREINPKFLEYQKLMLNSFLNKN
ncbi:hypothetical protein THO17_21160 [Marinomonas sp. THO17]